GGGAGQPVSALLVPTVCLCPAALAHGGGCPGPDSGLLRPAPGKRVPATSGPAAGLFSVVPVDCVQAFPRQGTPAGQRPETGRPPRAPASRFSGRRAPLSARADSRGRCGGPV